MLDFEALGVGCEFGMVQRVCGAEPLSLLRFSGSSIGNLTHLLENDFDGFLSLDDLQVGELALEYMVSSRRYGDFLAHTAVYVGDEEKAAMLARQARKFDYLKQRFQRDWVEAARIYVHYGCDDEAAIRRLHAALQRRSRCTLLWVVHASGVRPGRVERLQDGLFKGFLRYHGRFDFGPQLDIPSWVAICNQVGAAVRGVDVAAMPLGAEMDVDLRWEPGPLAVHEADATHGRCFLRVPTSYRMSILEATLTGPFAAKTFLTASLWVRLPANTDAKLFDVTIDDVVVLCQRRADLSLRETWQQLWVVAKLPRSFDTLRLAIRIDQAQQRSSFHFARWRVQHGSVVDESGRPADDEAFVGDAASTPRPAGRLRWASDLLRWAAALLERRNEAETVGPSLVNPTLAKSLLQTGDALMRAGLFDKADAILRVGCDLFPWNAEIESHFALSASWAGDHGEAIGRWTTLAAMFPHLANAHYGLAASLLALGEIDRAVTIVEGALLRFPRDACMLAEAARVYGAAGRWNEAVLQWDRALAINDEPVDWRRSRALAAAAIRNVSEHLVPLP